jgi:hypothetical protein
MPVLYANRAFSTLASSITNVDTSLSVAAGQGARFPAISGGDHFYATLDNNAGSVEIVKVTARSTDTFTIVRAQDGTSAQAFNAGAGVELRVVKAMLDDFKADTRTGYLPLTGGTTTGAVTVGTSGSASSTRALRIVPSGTNPGSFGSYTGSWRSTLEIWDNAGTRLVHITPPDGLTYNYSSIKSVDAGLRVDVGSNGGTTALNIEASGVVGTPQGLRSANVLASSGGFANDDSGIRIANPGGASLSTGASATGAIKIRLPAAALGSNTMISFRVRVYQYSVGRTQEFIIAGYNYYDSPTFSWYNVSAINLSDDGGDVTVRFGKDATSQCVYIGELGSSWDYPQIHVTDFAGGYSGAVAATWATGWSISFETSSFANVTGTRVARRNNDVRAWVNFNGTGTVSIRASKNVSSITDNGVGDYTVNFTTAMPDTSYSAVVSAQAESNGVNWVFPCLYRDGTPLQTGSARITMVPTGGGGGGLLDGDFICAAFLR